MKLSEGSRTSFGKRHPARGEAFRRKPKEAKDALPSGGSRRTPFLREEAEGRAFFNTSLTSGASFGKPPEVKLPEGRSEKSCFLREPLALPSESRHPTRGEAFRRKPKEAKQVHQAARGEAFRRTFRNKFASFGKPPEVKLPEGSEGRPSFGRKPKDALFSKQVQKEKGRPSRQR